MEQTFDSDIKPFIKTLNDLEQNKNRELDLLGVTLRRVGPEINKILIRNEEREKITKERFNIFTCLTRHHLEELQTRFIRYLLNPKGTHDCGFIFLKAFIDNIIANESIKNDTYFNSLCNISNEEIENAIVENKDKYSAEYGKMDIFIEMKSMIIVIENKTANGEQDSQIERYVNYCEDSGKGYIVLFLTPTGWESQQANGKIYYKISYSEHLISWIDKCTYQTLEYPMVYTSLRQYKNLILTYIIKKQSNNVIMEMKDLLLKPENSVILKYWDEMNSAIEPIRDQLRTEFFIAISKKLNTKLAKFIVNVGKDQPNYSIKDICKITHMGFILINDEYSFHLNDENQMIFAIQQNGKNLYFGLNILNIKNDRIISWDFKMPEITNNIVSSMRNELHDFNEFNTDTWYFSTNFIYNNMRFFDSKITYDLATKMPEIVDKFVVEVEEYLVAWKNTIENIKSK